MRVRVRVAGGQVASDWVTAAHVPGMYHAIIQDMHFGGQLELGTDLIIDIEEEDAPNGPEGSAAPNPRPQKLRRI